jgi:hypothetical protein
MQNACSNAAVQFSLHGENSRSMELRSGLLNELLGALCARSHGALSSRMLCRSFLLQLAQLRAKLISSALAISRLLLQLRRRSLQREHQALAGLRQRSLAPRQEAAQRTPTLRTLKQGIRSGCSSVLLRGACKPAAKHRRQAALLQAKRRSAR